jgi:predicted RNase H-like HicB family nuclease
LHRFLIVLEKNSESYTVYAPDLPGCVATGASREEAERNMTKAVESHIRSLLEQGLPLPPVKSIAEYVAIEPGNNS